MNIEKLRIAFGLAVALIVPLFFLAIYLGSCVSRLSRLRAHCRLEMETLLNALRRRRALARRWIEQQRQENASETALLRRLEQTLERLETALRDGQPAQKSEERVRTLGEASRDLDEILSRLEPPAEPPHNRAEWAQSGVELLAASRAYDRSVQTYTQARRQRLLRPLVAAFGFAPFPSFCAPENHGHPGH